MWYSRVSGEMRAATKRQRGACGAKCWKYTKNGETTVPRGIADKFISWVDRFKTMGDIVSSFDPTHAALP